MGMSHSKPYKQRILDFLETVGSKGADNTRIREATGIPSHQQVYLLTQELAMRGEIASGRQGKRWIYYPLDAPAPEIFRCVWRIASSPDFDQEYLKMETRPYVCIGGSRFTFDGKFHFGLVQGDIFGRMDGRRVIFSFEATDEMDPVHGAGIMIIEGESLLVRLLFHHGDEYTFVCVRS